jgi:hypothetical protein
MDQVQSSASLVYPERGNTYGSAPLACDREYVLTDGEGDPLRRAPAKEGPACGITALGDGRVLARSVRGPVLLNQRPIEGRVEVTPRDRITVGACEYRIAPPLGGEAGPPRGPAPRPPAPRPPSLEDLRLESAGLRERNQALGLQKAALEETCAEERRRRAEAEDASGVLKQELAAACAALAAEKEDRRRAEAALAKQAERHARQLKEKDAEIERQRAASRAAIEEIEGRRAKAVEENRDLRGRLATAAGQIEAGGREQAALKQKNDELKGQLNQQAEERQKLAVALAEAEMLNQAAHGRIDSLISAETRIIELRGQIKALQTAQTEHRARIRHVGGSLWALVNVWSKVWLDSCIRVKTGISRARQGLADELKQAGPRARLGPAAARDAARQRRFTEAEAALEDALKTLTPMQNDIGTLLERCLELSTMIRRDKGGRDHDGSPA